MGLIQEQVSLQWASVGFEVVLASVPLLMLVVALGLAPWRRRVLQPQPLSVILPPD